MIKVQEEWLNEETGKFACPLCKKEYSKNGISTHIWRIHGEGKNHKAGKPKGHQAWNKGLTKEMDERVKINSENCSKTSLEKYKNGYVHPNSTEEYWSKERRDRHSKTMSESLKLQYKNGRNAKGGYTEYLNYNGVKVQGTYEFRMCKVLDKMKDQGYIIGWEYTKDRFPYVDEDGNSRTYLLDFKVFNNDGTFYYVETKGFIRKNDELKWKAVRDLGFRLDVLFDEDIKKLEMPLW